MTMPLPLPGVLSYHGVYRVIASLLLAGAIPDSLQLTTTLSLDFVLPLERYESSESPPLVQIDERGAFYVVDRHARSIYVFDSTGKAAYTIGDTLNAGNWFRTAVHAGWRGDSLWVADAGANRIVLIPKTAGRVRAMPVLSRSPREDLTPGTPIAMLNDGTYLLEYAFSGGARSPRGIRTPIGIVERDGELRSYLVQRLVRFPVDVIVSSGKSTFLSYQPFSDDPILATSSGGEFAIQIERGIKRRTIRSAIVTLTCFDLRSRLHSTDQLEYPLLATGVEAIGSARRRGVEILLRSHAASDSAAASAWMTAHMFAPAFHPAIEEAVVGRDGTIALRLASDNATEATWEWRRCGIKSIARAILPRSVLFQEVRGERLWGLRYERGTGRWHAVRYDVSVATRKG